MNGNDKARRDYSQLGSTSLLCLLGLTLNRKQGVEHPAKQPLKFVYPEIDFSYQKEMP